MRRICFLIQSFSGWWSSPLFSLPECLIQGWYCKEKLDAGHSKGLKGEVAFPWERKYETVFDLKEPKCNLEEKLILVPSVEPGHSKEFLLMV